MIIKLNIALSRKINAKKEQMQQKLHLLFFAYANGNGCPYSTRVLTKVKTGDAMGDKDRYDPIRR